MDPYRHLDTLITRVPVLAGARQEIAAAYETLAASFQACGQLLIAGNGGSAADAGHIVGELMKSFILPRPMPEAFRQAAETEDPLLGRLLGERLQQGLPALALSAHSALGTAWINDCDPDLVYAQQVAGYGRKGAQGHRPDRSVRRTPGRKGRCLHPGPRNRDLQGTGIASASLSLPVHDVGSKIFRQG